MKLRSLLLLPALLLTACGSDSASDSASVQPRKVQPQMNVEFLGTWRSQCESSTSSSNRSDMSIAADGTIHAVDTAYPSTDCTGTPLETWTTDMTYLVLASTANQLVLEMSNIVSNPPVTGAHVERLAMELTRQNANSALGRTIGAFINDGAGVTRFLTEEEIAAIPALSLTKLD